MESERRPNSERKTRRREKRKRWLQRKKFKAAEERARDREERIEKQAELLMEERLRQQITNTGKEQAIQCDNGPSDKDAPLRKKPRGAQSASSPLKEIESDHLVKTGAFIGSGTFGNCYLAFYRNMTVVVKELKLLSKHQGSQSDKDADKRTKQELIHEAEVITQLGDHPGLPLLFGICSKRQPYKLVLQFHGEGKTSLTISRALRSKRINSKKEWLPIMKRLAEALQHIHDIGYLHNDLKSNNVLLERRGNLFAPVIIDFGKSKPLSESSRPKNLNQQERERYRRKYPHIAPEIVEGQEGQSLSSDIFSFAKIIEEIFESCKLGEMPDLIYRCLSSNPLERPSCSDILKLL